MKVFLLLKTIFVNHESKCFSQQHTVIMVCTCITKKIGVGKILRLLTCENVPTQFDTCTQMLDYNTILSEHIMDYHENHMSVLNQGNWECCTKFSLDKICLCMLLEESYQSRLW